MPSRSIAGRAFLLSIHSQSPIGTRPRPPDESFRGPQHLNSRYNEYSLGGRMIRIRRSNERGGGDHGWLKTRHTFSFSDYWDDKWMGFRSLRVINEDFVGPSTGFPAHPHRDMEIITYILSGELEHKDSLGTGSVIRPGDGQRMTAGRGIRHSEHNPSATETAHLLQIWITPSKQGLEPSYEQKSFPESEKRGKLRLIASNDGADGSVRINQDANLFVSLLAA